MVFSLLLFIVGCDTSARSTLSGYRKGTLFVCATIIVCANLMQVCSHANNKIFTLQQNITRSGQFSPFCIIGLVLLHMHNARLGKRSVYTI